MKLLFKQAIRDLTLLSEGAFLPCAKMKLWNSSWTETFSRDKCETSTIKLDLIRHHDHLFLKFAESKRPIGLLIWMCNSWSRDELSVNTKIARFWKSLLARTERAYSILETCKFSAVCLKYGGPEGSHMQIKNVAAN